MNFYFVGFSLYAVLILPLTIRFRVRLGSRSGYRVRLQAAGLPFVRKRDPDDARDERPIEEKEVARNIAATDLAILKALLNRRVRRKLVKAFRVESLSVYARVACADACHTALLYSAADAFLRSLRLSGALPPGFCSRLEVSFDSQGSEALLQGIVSIRLGSLLPAAALFTAAYRKARLAETEEEAYAAASH